MFGLGIHFLMGWAMAATDGAKKEKAEWPPHPDRVFMALAAAWFETGQDMQEGQTLRWLEAQAPPDISASDNEFREIVNCYVPVNDASVAERKTVERICANPKTDLAKYQKNGLSVLPEFRSKQKRCFPVAIPHIPIMYLVWKADVPEIYIEPLFSLCRKVISVGHPASLVQMWLTADPPIPNLVPTGGVVRRRLRIFCPGRLQYLEDHCNRNAVIEFLDREAKIKQSKGKEKKQLQIQQKARFPSGAPVSLRPEPGLWQGYEKPKQSDTSSFAGSLFEPNIIIFSLSGQRMPLQTTLKLTEAFRGALFSGCRQPIPEWISGHDLKGGSTLKPHIALLPLSFSGSNHADGRLMGIAIALPRDLDTAEVDHALAPCLWDDYGEPLKIKLFDGYWLECTTVLETRESPPVNLRPETWTVASRHWATVTPLVLDRHFNGKNKWRHAVESVKDACLRIGLPRPADVRLHSVSMFEGVPCSNEFPYLTRKKDNGKMYHIHAEFIFNESVQGPVVVGAGRFRGYGFCRPIISRGQWE